MQKIVPSVTLQGCFTVISSCVPQFSALWLDLILQVTEHHEIPLKPAHSAPWRIVTLFDAGCSGSLAIEIKLFLKVAVL